MGRGKVERVIETVQQQFMVEVAGDERHPARHPVSSLDELNRLLEAWVRVVYHARPHSGTGQAPRDRWEAAGPQFLPDSGRLRQAFAWSEVRLVRKTATVELEKNVYSVDPFLVGRKVELVFDPADMSEVDVYWQGRKAGRGVPQVIGRHSHPKAPPDEDDPPPLKLTGTDYLGIVAAAGDADLAALERGCMPCSTSERAVLLIAASLAEPGVTVSLRECLGSLDRRNIALVTAANG